MDEPTDGFSEQQLDKMRSVLEELNSNQLIIVSHDRYFLDKLVDHLFIFEGDGVVKDYHSNYTEYTLMMDAKSKQQKSLLSSEKKEKKKPKKDKKAKK